MPVKCVCSRFGQANGFLLAGYPTLFAVASYGVETRYSTGCIIAGGHHEWIIDIIVRQMLLWMKIDPSVVGENDSQIIFVHNFLMIMACNRR